MIESNANLEGLKMEIETLKKQVSHWQERAQRDALTGCLRRDAFMDLINERKKMGLLPQTVTLAILDVDHFKKINDTFGHLVGDEVLKELGKELNGELDAGSVVCRMGGEEFVVLIPGSLETAHAVIERFRKKIESWMIQVSLNRKVSFTVSAGLAEWNTDRSMLEATAEADGALYNAKNNGRNQVVSVA